MTNDIVVRLPHSIGQDEAARRLRQATEHIRDHYGTVLTLSEVAWAADRVTFAASALGQTIRGEIEIQSSYVELRASLPFLLRMVSNRMSSVLRDNGVKLLGR